MLIEILLALLIGILAGTLTGLTPGIHINLIGAFLVTLSFSLFSQLEPIYLVVFITSTAITHTFLDFIPSVFLGCPDTDTELSILPGHKLLKKGQGYEAIILTDYGSLAAIFIIILIAAPAIVLISKISSILPLIIPGLLIFATIFIISTERNRFKAFNVFILTGFLGYLVLNLDSINQPLLPLLTGLFGASMLIISIKTKTKISKQKITKPKTKLFKPLLGSLIASPLCSFLPGLGAGQAAIIGSAIARTNKKGFLILLGATNTLVMGFSFISLYVISKTRTGATVVIKEIIGTFEKNALILILGVILITGILSFFLTKEIAKFASQKINKINYTKTSLFTLFVLVIIVLLISGIYGLIVLIISTLIGIYCISSKVKRTLMMGCLMVPTLFFYLF